MTEENKHYLAFNRGVVSSRGLSRIDVERIGMSADQQSNFVPRVLGSMMLRPGMEFLGRTRSDTISTARQMPFVFGVDDTAILEVTDGAMRVMIDDEFITVESVSTAVENGDFTDGAIADWTDESDTGGTITYAGSGNVKFMGDGTDFARIRQEVTVILADQGVEHCLEIFIFEGNLSFRVGSTAGDDDYVSETLLGRGRHSILFTPTGNFFIDFASERTFNSELRECNISANGPSGDMEIQTPWDQEDLPFLRWEQSGDVIYVACQDGNNPGDNIPTHKIERRGSGRSWSVVAFEPEDGPFRVQNTSGITMTPSALSGDITITASQAFFNANHAVLDTSFGKYGALIRIASNGQNVSKAISGADDWTDPIRVIGAENSRTFQIILTGTWVATVKLQFGFTEDGPWNDLDQSFTANTNTTYDDGQEDSIIYYRIGVDTGDYTSGTVTASLVYSNGSIEGIAKITNVTTSTLVNAKVLRSFGSLDPSKDWWEGDFSYRRGYPTAVVIDEGRLWLAGEGKIKSSVSDGYETFDDAIEGDSGPISRSIGSGPIKVINWLLSMSRLLIGTSDTSANVAAQRLDGNNPLSVRSSSFDEPLTRTNFNIKPASSKGVFVDRTEQRLYELTYDIDVQDYKSVDLSVFAPEFNIAGITQIAVQMKPDIRIHCVRRDGTVGMLVYDRLENVICWIDIVSDGASGEIENVAVLPGLVEDQVYYIVKRTINGGTQRHICKWAQETEAVGGTVNKIADSFVHYSGSATSSPFSTELVHLADESVEVWADGVDVGPLIVGPGGSLSLPSAASEVVAGLGYTARFKSAKLGSLPGIGLLERKKVNRIGFIAENLHHLGLRYGPDFDNLSDMPQVEGGQEIVTDTVHAEYHEDNFEFGGEWETDSRICLESSAPKPCTIMAAIAEVESIEKSTTRR